MYVLRDIYVFIYYFAIFIEKDEIVEDGDKGIEFMCEVVTKRKQKLMKIALSIDFFKLAFNFI